MRFSSRCSGVISRGAAFSMPAMCPISVSIPVATTRRPCHVAAVPLKIILRRSPRDAAFSIGAISFMTGRLSPVSAASAV